jgi:hypothetical protein
MIYKALFVMLLMREVSITWAKIAIKLITMLTQWLPLSCSSPSMNDTLADFTLNINHAASQGQGFILLSRSLESAVQKNGSVPNPTVELHSRYQNLADVNVLKQQFFYGFQNSLALSLWWLGEGFKLFVAMLFVCFFSLNDIYVFF